MIVDKDTEFSLLQAVTTSAASTNVVDQGAAGDSFKSPPTLVIKVGTGVTADGAGTVTFALQTATDEAFSSPITLWSTAAIGKASLTANSIVARVPFPTGCLRYLRVYYTVATGPLTAGTFSAFLVRSPDKQI